MIEVRMNGLKPHDPQQALKMKIDDTSNLFRLMSATPPELVARYEQTHGMVSGSLQGTVNNIVALDKRAAWMGVLLLVLGITCIIGITIGLYSYLYKNQISDPKTIWYVWVIMILSLFVVSVLFSRDAHKARCRREVHVLILRKFESGVSALVPESAEYVGDNGICWGKSFALLLSEEMIQKRMSDFASQVLTIEQKLFMQPHTHRNVSKIRELCNLYVHTQAYANKFFDGLSEFGIRHDKIAIFNEAAQRLRSQSLALT